jgi:dTDP-4-amino-4,6-dideoxygalactose transaminase
MTAQEVTPTQSVPFLDISRQHHALKQELLERVGELIDSSAFINGPQVAELEAAFADYCGVAECVGLASGLDALRLGLQALGIGAGDEVIVPAMTFVATWEAVSQVGATPVPVDVSEADYCIDPDLIAGVVTPRSRAIVPVHLYGQVADLPALISCAQDSGLALLEDACQAVGARRAGLTPGSGSAAAAFSFYPAKNLGALGDAGALVTNDASLAAEVRALREHGQERKYVHDRIGWTARLDTIQALALLLKLPHVDRWNDERRAAAFFYSEALAGAGDLVLPPLASSCDHVWHLYVVRTRDPKGMIDHLRARRVGTSRHYPEPPHLSRAYAELGYGRGSFPVAEAIADGCVSLPLFPGITQTQLEVVVDAVAGWFARG